LQRGKLVSSLSVRGEADGATFNTPTATDRSPLIKHATSPPPIIADAIAFDNVAISEPPAQESVSGFEHVDRKLSESTPEAEVGRTMVGKEATSMSTLRSVCSKKRKVLSIVR